MERLQKGGRVNELHLFAGAGGGILGGHLLGFRTVCAVELEPYPASVLCARQNDGLLPPFPVWDDVRTFDGRPWRGIVDVVSGGFPCQDISAAGTGAGIEGERSGLWAEMHRIICEVRPRFAFVENSPMLTSRGLGRVLGDLAESGYDAEWMVLGADDVGAPHIRKRMWILASDTDRLREQQRAKSGNEAGNRACYGNSNDAHINNVRRNRMRGGELEAYQEIRTPGATVVKNGGQDDADAYMPGRQEQWRTKSARQEQQAAECGNWWASEPDVVRMVHGVAARVDRIKALGNGQVPAVAATAFCELYRRFES